MRSWLAIPPGSWSMAADARRALIIATGSYVDTKLRALRAPSADAQGLRAVLEDPAVGDFAVDVMVDGNEES